MNKRPNRIMVYSLFMTALCSLALALSINQDKSNYEAFNLTP
jgi:hypothetical protein